MNETEKYIKSINVSTFKGTICLSEKEFERHLSIFAYQRATKFLDWQNSRLYMIYESEMIEEIWDEFLKEEEHERDVK